MSYQDDEDIKEDFCPACLAVPLAMAGAGAGIAGTMDKGKKHKTQKKMLVWVGVLTVVFAVLFIIYYKFIKKCEECR